MIINGRKKENDDVDEEEEMKLFDKVVQKSYLVKLALIKKKLLQ